MTDLIDRLRLGDGTSPDHWLLLEAADALEKSVECMCGICKLGPQQRKPLTRDEVEKLFWEWKDRSGYSIALFEFRNICNAIEAAHGIKE